jgi:hypothetical protein
VTPVGNVVSDAVPVRTGDDDDVAVCTRVVLDDGDPVGECVDVFEDELDPVMVIDTRIVTDFTPVLVIVLEVVEVLLDEALPVSVGDDDDDRELLPDGVSVEDVFDDLDSLAESEIVGDLVIEAVAVLPGVTVLTEVRDASADGDSFAAPDAVYDILVVGLPEKRALDDGVLLFVEELVVVEDLFGVNDTVFVGPFGVLEAMMEKDCVGDPVEVRLALGVNVLLPEPEAVFDVVIDDV